MKTQVRLMFLALIVASLAAFAALRVRNDAREKQLVPTAEGKAP